MNEQECDADLATTKQEVFDDLKMFQRDILPVEIWLSPDYSQCEDPEDQECFEGFVVSVGEDFAITARLWQRSWLNGFRAVSVAAIEEVLSLEDEDFICRVMKAAGDPLPPAMPITAKTMAGLVETVCEHYPLVILAMKPPGDPSDVAGVIQSVSGGTIRVKLVSRQGFWIPEEETIEISNVVSLLFGSEYEKRLGMLVERSP